MHRGQVADPRDERITALSAENERLREDNKELKQLLSDAEDEEEFRIKQLRSENERLSDCLQLVKDWCEAYPLSVFPEPNFNDVRIALEARGINLDAVSASNMRHVINGIKRLIDKAMKDA